MNTATIRPALGEVAKVGTLYDATTDSFLTSIFGSQPCPDEVLSCKPTKAKPVVRTITADTYQDKFRLLSLSPDLGASILSRLVRLDSHSDIFSGSRTYLARQRNTNADTQAALVHRLPTVQERIALQSPSLKSSIDWRALQGTRATHVVVGVDYGAETVVEINHHRLVDGQTGQSGSAVEVLKATLKDVNANGVPPPSQLGPAALDINVLSDVLPGLAPVRSVGEAAEILFRQVPQALSHVDMGKGKPVTYRILSLPSFMGHVQGDDEEEDEEEEEENDDRGKTTPTGATFVQVNPDLLNSFSQTFDELLAARRRLADYTAFLSANGRYVSPNHLNDVWRVTDELGKTIADLEASYSRDLSDVRKGSRPTSVLSELHHSVVAAIEARRDADVVDQEREKIEFLAGAVGRGATCIGHYSRTGILDLLESQPGSVITYVLSFSSATMRDASWPANKELLFELLDVEHRAGVQIVLEDCDATGFRIEVPRIVKYQGVVMEADDVLDKRRFLADKSLAQCDERTLETQDLQKPVKSRFLKLPCPGPRCGPGGTLSWICPRCSGPLEYGYSDKFIYCECGRSHFRNFTFLCCNAATHGKSYVPFRDKKQLEALLQGLVQDNCVNILIMGETGVGKSTFINAFINYLAFKTLDEALGEELRYVIPTSFQTQVMDRSRSDGKIVQHKITVGNRDDEKDGSKGDSATQQTSVYPITIEDRTIRLIDTPGVGDTRGVQFDKKNMADILATLNSYDELHGILILLKSNNARLTITFEFCVKELLTHLHRSAVGNIAFGFTNTRISNYTPGDTFGPLETLLSNQPDVQLSLDMKTSYCFDSESFRYLAAYKQGVVMENIEDFRRSWKHSSEESRRLVDHFQSKPPHSVTSTISLNGTRQLILELTKPLADISQLIRQNIAMCKDREKELANTRLSGDALRKKLQFEQILLRQKELTMPRTVCTEGACINIKDDGTGKQVTEYKSICHSQCYLDDVPTQTLRFPGLVDCWAFDGKDNCRRCQHHWHMHVHIMYEFEEYTATMTDATIEAALAANADDTTLRQKGVQELQQLIREYQHEHAQVQKAAAEFGLYLKKNSITAYNDATLDYLDMLIKQEKEKIAVGGDRARMDALLEDRQRHEELVDALTARMQQPKGSNNSYTVLGERGVDTVVRGLYGLKHFGAQLRSVQNTISTAHQATYRERPYKVFSGRYRPSTKRSPRGGGSNSGGGGGNMLMGVINAGMAAIGLSNDPQGSSSRGHGGGHYHEPPRGGYYGPPHHSASSGSSYYSGHHHHHGPPSGAAYYGGGGPSHQPVPRNMYSPPHGQANLQFPAVPQHNPWPHSTEEEGYSGVADSGRDARWA